LPAKAIHEDTMSADVGQVRAEPHGRVLKIVIDNPAKKNAFSPEMMEQLSAALTRLDGDADLWAGVICAEGDHFTAGLDMPKFFGPGATAKPLAEGAIDPLGLKNRCRKPIVTAVQGVVFTVGVELMLAGDIVVAAVDSRFAQLEARRGIAPLGGAHFRYLSRMGWGDAMYHLLLCDEFDAERALKIGLVQEVVAPGAQVDRAMALATKIAENAPIGIQVTKAAALKYLEANDAVAIAAVPGIRERVLGSSDAMEGIMSFMERRPAVFTGR
jgi:enoyl-CoA hydratase